MHSAASLLTIGLLAGLHLGSDAPQLSGVRLEMAKARVHTVLDRIADYKSEDENQEVWTLKNDPSIQSLIVGYAPDNRVRYLTTLPKTAGKALPCQPLGDIKKAQVAGTAGNYVYTRSWKQDEDEFVASARAEAGHLTRCSVKKVGVGFEDEAAERADRKHE